MNSNKIVINKKKIRQTPIQHKLYIKYTKIFVFFIYTKTIKKFINKKKITILKYD